ncbi:hypothetical protein Purlil1_4841 [Purpureocillium lilacinum]|uniref:Uncharacterized protein n=1 Tax=Purpureocillium lilacinum TaxID=33203 RepID=A0ABR0C3C6_PURLI|nr:hypothetical protein Purlil1_4841 [Purpureocillium lilacinum]
MPVVADITRKTLFFKANNIHAFHTSSVPRRPRHALAAIPPAALPSPRPLQATFQGPAVGQLVRLWGIREPARPVALCTSRLRVFCCGLRLDPFVCVARARAAHPAHADRRARAAPLALAILTPRGPSHQPHNSPIVAVNLTLVAVLAASGSASPVVTQD